MRQLKIQYFSPVGANHGCASLDSIYIGPLTFEFMARALCCATWCSFNNIITFKTTDQMMLDIGGFRTFIEYLIAIPIYGNKW